MNLIKQLRLIGNKEIEYNEAKKLGLNISLLKNKGFIVIKIKENKNLSIPDGTPRYAKRFAFTRKKYGITENTTSDKFIKITKAGLKIINKKEIEDEEIKPINDKEEQYEIQD